ncbi:porin [Paracoccus sp. S-4012]|uniref:porin n=1 Tax=Paracoccus sp. S-4012 TaxID=2665648 RepID=UPI0018A1C0FA|nr:porin [Paracoccus sp. S-4012]
MKKLLLASSALVGLAGAAAAEVSVTGDGRIGLRFDSDELVLNEAGVLVTRDTWNVISRARVRFTMTGETDSGLSFGAILRADQADSRSSRGGSNSLYAGEVFISGAFGRLTAGEVDSALESAVGDLPEVGLSGLNFYNEFQYSSSDFDELFQDAGLLYSYALGDATLYASFQDQYFRLPGDAFARERGDTWSLGAGYTLGNYSFGIGYEDSSSFIDPVGYAFANQSTAGNFYTNDATTWGVSGGTSFAGITFKAIYLATDVDGSADAGSWSLGDYDVNQLGVGAEYTMANGVGLKGFWRRIDGDSLVVGGATLDNEVDIWGLGAQYDLGGGAILKGGIAHLDGDSIAFGQDIDKTVADFGVALNF